jgi:glycosyltransferase involved in cell wall biosynthesis
MALVPLEAGASGRSVVISEVAGATEAVAPQAGLIVPREDAGALAAAVATRLADRSYADEEGAAARAHVERNYGLDATGSRMWEVYQEVLGTAPIAAT